MLTQSYRKLKKGDKAPDFKLEGVDGKIRTLSDFQGKEGLLVIFMCNHCPYVRSKLARILQLYEKWKDRIYFVGINSNDPNFKGEGMENMKVFARENKIEFPYLFDRTQKVAKDFGATCTPDSFLFDKDMKLVFHGRIDDALLLDQQPNEFTLDNKITDLILGKEIREEFEPSMGCSIKWLKG